MDGTIAGAAQQSWYAAPDCCSNRKQTSEVVWTRMGCFRDSIVFSFCLARINSYGGTSLVVVVLLTERLVRGMSPTPNGVPGSQQEAINKKGCSARNGGGGCIYIRPRGWGRGGLCFPIAARTLVVRVRRRTSAMLEFFFSCHSFFYPTGILI